MNTRLFAAALALQLVLGLAGARAAAPVTKAPDTAKPPNKAKDTSDLATLAKRLPTIESAERLTRAPAPAPVPADVKNPFNPADFNKPDPDDKSAAGRNPLPGAPAQPAAPPGNRETLEALAARIPSTGTINLGGKRLLIVGKNRLEIGTKFTVAYNGQDYELELVAIESTTFTLRYRGEETTRPIRSVK